MLIRVHARIPQHFHVPLQLLDLVQIVNERLADLLHKQWTIRHLELHLRLHVLVVTLVAQKFLLVVALECLTLLSQVRGVADDSGRALHTLLEAVLLYQSVVILLVFECLIGLLLLHLLATHLDSSVVLGRRGGLLDWRRDRGPGRVGSLTLERGVDRLVLLVHVRAEVG